MLTPYFDPTVHFILVCLCSTRKPTISWFDVTLINQSSKVICSKMLTGSGRTKPQRDKRVYNHGQGGSTMTILDLRPSGPGGPPIPNPSWLQGYSFDEWSLYKTTNLQNGWEMKGWVIITCTCRQFLSPANYLASVILVAAPPEFVFGWLASLNKPWQKIQLKTTHLLLHNMDAYGCSYLEEKITVFICWSSNVKMDWHHKQNHKCT